MSVDRNGILILFKPQDWTSFDVIAKARGILGTRKVGHSGTLDPFATGLLLITVGKATKVNQFLETLDNVFGERVCYNNEDICLDTKKYDSIKK